jgi:ABC-type glycerol-3-phosphate transport system substrate-binding protein
MTKPTPHATLPRLLALLLAAGMLLSACQNSELPQAQETAQPKPNQTQPAGQQATRATGATAQPVPTATQTIVPEHMLVDPRDLRGVEVHFWHPWSGATARVVADMVAEFNRENVWGIQAVAQSTGGSGEIYWQVAAAEKDHTVPDVIAAPPDLLRYWDRQERVADLTDYEANPEWGMSAQESADYYPVFWEQDQADGRQLGIPAERSARMMFYNRSWARDLGFDAPPETPQEFQRQACAAAQALAQDDARDNDGLGGWIIDRDAMSLLGWQAAFGGSPAAEPGAALKFNTGPNAEAFTYLRNLFDQGCAWISRDPLPYDYFATRRALLYSGSPEQITLQIRALARANNTDEWLPIPFPSGEGDGGVVASGVSYGILRSTPERQLAGWLLIRHLALTRNQVRLVESTLSLPVSSSARAGLSGLAGKNREWGAALDVLPERVQAARVPAEWWAARGVLEDAAWQLFQLTPVPSDTILKQADQMVPDLLQHLP